MRTRLIKIGNSRGVRLPEALIEQAGLRHELELEVREGEVVIRPAEEVRRGWSNAAAACREAEEDCLPDWDALAGDFLG